MPDPRNRLKWNATCKAYPAVADLQAIAGFARVEDIYVAVASAAYTQEVYTVPADRILVIDAIFCTCNSAFPDRCTMFVFSGGTDYWFYRELHPNAWYTHLSNTQIVVDEGEEIRVLWNDLFIGNTIYAFMFGRLYAKY